MMMVMMTVMVTVDGLGKQAASVSLVAATCMHERACDDLGRHGLCELRCQ